MARPPRILLAKPGLDTHDLGIKLVAHALREAGMEVLYLGVFRDREQILKAALEEDVDLIGLSFLSGGHLGHTRELLEYLRAHGAGHVPVVVGGIIPEDDVPALQALGVHRVFGPGTPRGAVVAAIREILGRAAPAPTGGPSV
ncbi:MAG: cobalamin B12-binding domain-containing protein [Candidatus Rokubacteria bacterium]|nr:cobalamin B12-binding domain-containing protein [Candidatus Rokubacteria bacterium]